MDLDNHPLQPVTLHAHVIVAPLWMFAFGVLWQSHILPKLRSKGRVRRRTGIALMALTVPMAISGYLLQTSVEESWREVWIVVHVGGSVAWIIAFLVHLAVPSREPGRPQ